MILNPFRVFKRGSVYPYYWTVNTMSLIGSWIDFTLRQWLITTMFNSEKLISQYVGIYNLVRFIPSFIISSFAGYLVDKFGGRFILFLVNIFDFFNSFGLFLLIYSGKLNPFNFIIFAIFLGITNSFYFPSRSKFINSMSRDENDLPGFFSWQGISFNLSRIVGPILAAYIANSYGLHWGFLVNSLSYVPLILFLMFYSDKIVENLISQEKISGSSNFFANIKVYFSDYLDSMKLVLSYIFSNIDLKKCFGVIFTINFLGMSLLSFFQVFTKNVLNKNVDYFSILLTSLGAGAIIGALIIASLDGKTILNIREEFLLFLYGLGIYFLTMFYNFSPLIIFVIGFFQALVFGITNNKLQLITPKNYIGKVTGVYSLFNISLSYLGSFVISNVAYLLGLLISFKVVALIIVFLSFVIWFMK